MDKIYLPYEFFKSLCLCVAEQIKKDIKNVDEIVAISRGGISAAHIIAKELKLQMGYFFPRNNDSVLVLNKKDSKNIVIIEDLIAKGRTHQIVKNFFLNKDIKYYFVPILIDGNFSEYNFDIYGMKTKHWIVFPYENYNKMNVGDRGFFREGTDNYGE